MSIMSSLRLALLLGMLTAMFLAAGYYFAGTGGMMIGLALAFATNLLSYWYSDKFVLALYNAKKADKKDCPELFSSLQRICKKAEIPVPPLYVINAPAPNAFATGRNPKNAAVAVTKGLMEKLDKKEAEAVLAHEIGHVKNRDILVSTMAATMAGALTWIAHMFMFGGDERNRNALSYALMLVAVPVAATLIRLAITRSREFGADKTGALLSNPLDLASALEKISSVAKSAPLRGSESTAHLFIVNPFTAGNMVKLFSTHPPVEERVARLREMKNHL